ncbi:hypothetical protein DSUL_90004 [Desulfovibrionales bacterium]
MNFENEFKKTFLSMVVSKLLPPTSKNATEEDLLAELDSNLTLQADLIIRPAANLDANAEVGLNGCLSLGLDKKMKKFFGPGGLDVKSLSSRWDPKRSYANEEEILELDAAMKIEASDPDAEAEAIAEEELLSKLNLNDLNVTAATLKSVALANPASLVGLWEEPEGKRNLSVASAVVTVAMASTLPGRDDEKTDLADLSAFISSDQLSELSISTETSATLALDANEPDRTDLEATLNQGWTATASTASVISGENCTQKTTTKAVLGMEDDYDLIKLDVISPDKIMVATALTAPVKEICLSDPDVLIKKLKFPKLTPEQTFFEATGQQLTDTVSSNMTPTAKDLSCTPTDFDQAIGYRPGVNMLVSTAVATATALRPVTPAASNLRGAELYTVLADLEQRLTEQTIHLIELESKVSRLADLEAHLAEHEIRLTAQGMRVVELESRQTNATNTANLILEGIMAKIFLKIDNCQDAHHTALTIYLEGLVAQILERHLATARSKLDALIAKKIAIIFANDFPVQDKKIGRHMDNPLADRCQTLAKDFTSQTTDLAIRLTQQLEEKLQRCLDKLPGEKVLYHLAGEMLTEDMAAVNNHNTADGQARTAIEQTKVTVQNSTKSAISNLMAAQLPTAEYQNATDIHNDLTLFSDTPTLVSIVETARQAFTSILADAISNLEQRFVAQTEWKLFSLKFKEELEVGLDKARAGCEAITDRLREEAETRLETLQTSISERLDQAAAEATARVIREEIFAILHEKHITS